MYVSDSYKSLNVTYIDMRARDFFLGCLDAAKKYEPQLAKLGRETPWLKEHCPIVHISYLDGMSHADMVTSRTAVHSRRARRDFILGDVDYNPGQEKDALSLRHSAMLLADELHTPLMLYPTLSYPAKPRFRFVFLTADMLDAEQYAKAVKWVYDRLGYPVTDKNDYLMNNNKNLPLFNNEKQVKQCWETFSDTSLSPLSSELWKDVVSPVHISRGKSHEWSETRHADRFDEGMLVELAKGQCEMAAFMDGGTFWRVIGSLAASCFCGGISEECAEAVLDALAEGGRALGRAEEWRSSNRTEFSRAMMRMNAEKLAVIRPLSEWTEFAPASV